MGTANPSRILAQMQETKDKNASEQGERAKLDTEEKQKVAELQELKKQRDDDKFHKKNSPEWNDATNKILEKSVQLQTWVELKKAELARRHKEEIKALFDKIQAAITQVAQDKKIDLIVADYGADLPEDLDTLTPDQLHALIRQKNVLFTNKGVDISDEVIIRLDRDYKANKK